MSRIESTNHRSARKFLRIAGPALVASGGILCITGAISFFSAFGGSEFPKYFWCLFLGMPIGFVGLIMCQFAYFGSVLRYVAAESAPVAADTANYLAEGTKDAVRTVTRSATDGVLDAMEERRGNPQDSSQL
jgi:hypothetical protein